MDRKEAVERKQQILANSCLGCERRLSLETSVQKMRPKIAAQTAGRFSVGPLDLALTLLLQKLADCVQYAFWAAAPTGDEVL